MDRTIDLAGYMIRRIEEHDGHPPTRMELMGLLYMTQRNAYAVLGEPAIDAEFEAWNNGPVCREILFEYLNGRLVVQPGSITPEVEYVANNVILEYEALGPEKFLAACCDGTAWRKAIANAQSPTKPDIHISRADIEEDSKVVRLYDHNWDMYYDEFPEAST